LWRDSSTDDSDPYVFAPNGLFPAPDADASQFGLLGLLCGKALLMDMLVPLPFSAAFFRLVRGEFLTVADVDPVLARSLAQPEGLVGLTFVYPGSETELCEGGREREVTPETVGEFVTLIERRTIELPAIVAEFRRALSTVVPWEFLRLFTPGETCAVIAGEPSRIGVDDLSFVKTAHGYEPESPQVHWLFEIIAEMSADEQEMFVQFATGAPNLPFGGLRALDPPLTIALRVPQNDDQMPDETLPSVMTCTNYFKVPAYSSKEVMRERVLRAIRDGLGAFDLS
jgi:E3 ubiquitin-protein ligase TRIP12